MLKSTRIQLVPLSADDLPRLWRWINDREQVLFNAPFRPVTESQHRAWFDEQSRNPRTVMFGIRVIDGEQLIGTTQLHGIDPVHRTAELQIRIGETSDRGRGYGTEAVNLLLDFAFRDLNLNRVSLHVFASNTAALRTYEKCGFRHEGLLRQAAHIDGQYVDVALLAVLRGELGR